jgi:hypothetical protein
LTYGSKILILNLLNISIFMLTATVTLTPIQTLINSARTGNNDYDLFTAGLALLTVAAKVPSTPLRPGATPTAPPIHPAYPAGQGIRGFFDAFRFSRNATKTDFVIKLMYSAKVLSRVRLFRNALVPTVAPNLLPILKPATVPVALTPPVDLLEQWIYDLVIARGGAWTPKTEPMTGDTWLEATGTFDQSIEQLMVEPTSGGGGGTPT